MTLRDAIIRALAFYGYGNKYRLTYWLPRNKKINEFWDFCKVVKFNKMKCPLDTFNKKKRVTFLAYN